MRIERNAGIVSITPPMLPERSMQNTTSIRGFSSAPASRAGAAAAAAAPGAMSLAAEGGTVIVLGSPRGAAQDVDFYTDLHRRSLRVLGAHDSGIGATVRERFPWTNDRMVPVVVDWVRRGKLPVQDLITHHVTPAALPEMYEGLLNDKERFLGVVVDWTGEVPA